MTLPQFDNTKEFETFHNVDDIQIIKINTTDSNKYLQRMRDWYEELKPYTDEKGSHKVMQIYFLAPPLSAILSFIEVPMPEKFLWNAVAIIEPPDSVVGKFNPIINWAANLNKYKERVTVKLYSHEYLNKADEVKEWLDKSIDEGPNNKVLEY